MHRIFSTTHAVAQFNASHPALNLHNLGAGDPLPTDVLPENPDEVFAQHGSRYLPLWDLAHNQRLGTVGEFVAAAYGLGEHAHFTGTCDQIADQLTRWHTEGGVDGFQFILGTNFEALCEHIVPAVMDRTR